MLVVDNHSFFTCRLVGTRVLVNAPVAAPLAQNTTMATAYIYNINSEIKGNSVKRKTVWKSGEKIEQFIGEI